MINVLHIHGFNSSPQSMKAQLTKQYFQSHYPKVNFYCPQLASTPLTAIEQLVAMIDQKPQQTWLLIGSSLGGYFATYLSQKYNLKAVLINPAVTPYLLLEQYIGEQINPYTKEVYQVKPDYIEQLKCLEQSEIKKNNYLLMAQTGDEVLDYCQAVEKYQGCQMEIQAGGDHSFINFEKMLPEIALFFNL